MKELSFDAKVIAGAVFGIGLTSLTFEMRESRPTPRTQEALDELVQRGDLTRETINGRGGVTYRPARRFFDEYAFVGDNRSNPAMKFNISEPLG